MSGAIHPRFLRVLGLGLLLWLGAYFAVTLLVDPYGVSPLRVQISHLNKIKPSRIEIDRIIKPYEVWRYQPKTVFLGTSRIHQSIDPSVLDGTRFSPVYNASIPASSLGLNISHLQQYLQLDPNLRTVVVELFLYNFLGQGQEHAPKDFYEYLSNSLKLFVSADTLWAAMQTVAYNLTSTRPAYAIKPGGYFYYPPGHNAKGPFDGYPTGIWKLHATRPKGMQLYEPAFEMVRKFVELCRQRNIELIFLLTPNHAYDDYYIDAIGAWDTVREWHSRLAAEDATIYSFSQPNDWVYEPVSEHMRYWNDPYHFSLEMGRGIEEFMAGKPVAALPKNFAVRLTPDNVANLIEARRTAIHQWALANPEFVAAFNDEKRGFEHPERKFHGDAVNSTVKTAGEFYAQMKKQFPRAEISQYRVVSDDLILANSVPAGVLRGGRMKNAWGGRILAQIFPANAWGPKVPPTYNLIFENVPRKDCSRLVEALWRNGGHKSYRINIEPSGKVYSRFPVKGADGCDDGGNSVGFTMFTD